MEYAGFGRRLRASIVDGLIVGVTANLLLVPFDLEAAWRCLEKRLPDIPEPPRG